MITIEKATRSDSLAIESLDRVVWERRNGGQRTMADADYTWRIWIEHALVYTAKDDGKLVGVALAFPAKSGRYCLHKIFTAEAYREQHAATLLADAILHDTDKLGVDVFVNVFSDNAKALLLFEKQGFSAHPHQTDTNRVTGTTLLTRPAGRKPFFSANNYLYSIYR